MHNPGLHEPRQSRSQQTLERILSSSTALIAEQSYDEVTIAEIARRAKISVGGFYSRFHNKEALLSVLLERLGQETQHRISAALADNWSNRSLQDLLRQIVSNNAELYLKYRGVLTVVHIQTRILEPGGDQSARTAYNENIVTQLVTLILKKRDQWSGASRLAGRRAARPPAGANWSLRPRPPSRKPAWYGSPPAPREHPADRPGPAWRQCTDPRAIPWEGP